MRKKVNDRRNADEIARQIQPDRDEKEISEPPAASDRPGQKSPRLRPMQKNSDEKRKGLTTLLLFIGV